MRNTAPGILFRLFIYFLITFSLSYHRSKAFSLPHHMTGGLACLPMFGLLKYIYPGTWQIEFSHLDLLVFWDFSGRCVAVRYMTTSIILTSFQPADGEDETGDDPLGDAISGPFTLNSFGSRVK